MARKRKRDKLPRDPVRAHIESLAHDGRGVCRPEGKTVFVEGALPGEDVWFRYTAKRKDYDEGTVDSIIHSSCHRVQARCPHYGLCGGCSLQHMDGHAQIQAKQQVLIDNLHRIGKVEPQEVLEPLTGPQWGYRRKARIGAKYVRKKGKVLVGFREKRSPYVADLGRCEVLHPSVGERIGELSELIGSMDARERIPQIEVAAADNATALVFRNLDELSEGDVQRLLHFSLETGLHIWLQPGGPDTTYAIAPETSQLFYGVDGFALNMRFEPTDFVQVNFDINGSMLRQALSLLDVGSEHRILDLFCGIGNFTLPIASRAAAVVGVEGEESLAVRARENAERNGINNAEFYSWDLTRDVAETEWGREHFDRVLLDPPRSGAYELMDPLARIGAQRIVYVSCHPGSLARDAGELVHKYGYRLVKAGVMDMFPHTAHVESIALFVRG